MEANLLKLIENQQKQQDQFQQQQAQIQQLLQILAGQPTGAVSTSSANNSTSTTDQKNLSDQFVPFVYDPENNLTFESWYKRYELIFTTELAEWKETAKIQLILQKFSQADYQHFSDSILPKRPEHFKFEEIVKLLNKLFGYRETKFSIRHKCFSLVKDEFEEPAQYAARINKNCEKFDIANCTVDDLKVLLFVKGLKSARDAKVLEILLSKVNKQHKQLEIATDDDARNAIKKLTLQDLVDECEQHISLKQDKNTVSTTNDSPNSSEVLRIEKNSKFNTPATNFSSHNFKLGQSSSKPPSACRFCGATHWERECDYKEKPCQHCHVIGHKFGFCVTANEALLRKNNRNRRRNLNSGPEQVHQVVEPVNRVSKRKFVTTNINGGKIRLQLDTASDITIISHENWKKLGAPVLQTSDVAPGSASGDKIKLSGSFQCKMNFNNKTASGFCYVSSNLNLLGIDFIEQLGLWNVPFDAICNHISMNDLSRVAQTRFPTLFSPGLGLCNKTKVSLELKPDARKIFRKSRPVPFAAGPAIEEEILRQQHLGVFTPTTYAEFAAPIVAVRKKNGKIRICGDYSTGLNDALVPNQFPLPTPEQIFTTLNGKKVFSKIDLSDAFLQLELDDEAKRLLTVNTHVGLFRVNRMQPGVKTAPGLFQELMTKMLSGTKGAVAFIDDIIVSGECEADHNKVLFDVLDRIQEYGFKLRIEKCEFGKMKLLFCGHIINSDGIKPDPKKILAIQEIPRPENISQLRSFLGAANYYGKFVKNINNLRGPLDELTRKDIKFLWRPDHEQAFLAIKKVLGSDLILTHFDPSRKIIVAADASCYGKGGVLMHVFPDGKLRPVMHVSASFSSAERNYPQIQREAAALQFAVKRFHKYLYGRNFELQTDHKPLLAIFGAKDGIPAYTASRLQRYALTLLAYDFNIKYVSTTSFGYADIISRLIAKHPREDEETVIASIQEDFEHQCFAIETAKSLPINFQDVQRATKHCPTLTKVAEFINTGWPKSRKNIQSSEVAKFFDHRCGLMVINGCIFHGDRIVIPQQFQNKILNETHHGHPGYVRMKLIAQSRVFWPGINRDIETKVKSCGNCAKVTKSPPKCTPQPWPLPSKPWSRIHADYAGPINGQYFLIIVDAFSNWPEIFKTTSTTTSKTIQLLQDAFSNNGLCDTLVTDNGPQFTADGFTQFMINNGIQHVRTAPYHPQSNGRAEKFVDILKTALSKIDGNIDEKLREFLTTYRSTPSYALAGKTPSELINNRSMKTRLDLLKQNSNTSQGAIHNLSKRFDVGTKVYYQLHRNNHNWEWVAANIVQQIGSVNYKIQLDNGRFINKAHANQLKLRHSSNELMEAFELISIHDTEIEPTIIPEDPVHNSSERTIQPCQDESQELQGFDDTFEDALDNSLIDEEQHEEATPTARHSTRANAGVPPSRYGWDQES